MEVNWCLQGENTLRTIHFIHDSIYSRRKTLTPSLQINVRFISSHHCKRGSYVKIEVLKKN